MLICIQGLGYVGAATAIVVSSVIKKNNLPKFQVVGIDLSTKNGLERIKKLNSGIFPFHTEDKNVQKQIKKIKRMGNFRASTSKEIYKKADVIIVSSNFDVDKNQRKISYNSFKKGIIDIAKRINEESLIIVQSTVPPGTCEKIVYPILRKFFLKRKLDVNKISIAHSYERVMPGKNYLDSIVNFWRVYSGINNQSAQKCKNFLSQVINVKDFPLTKLESTSASELSKLIENSYRAVNIAFIEEWSRFSENLKINLMDIISAIRKRPTHNNLRQPGFGVGGYCLTKDPLLAKISATQIWKFKNHEFPFSTLATKINKKMPLVTYSKVISYFKKWKKNKPRILLLGLSYREDVDDTRNSPSEIFYRKALKERVSITIHDPKVKYWKEIGKKINNKLVSLNNINCVILAVPHQFYKKINFTKWISNNRNILFYDANNVLNKNQISQIIKKQCKYYRIGKN